jgi:hypothetical protein
MTEVELLTILFASLAMAVGVWIGSKIVSRMGVRLTANRSLRSRFITGAIITAAVAIGVWIANRGEPVGLVTIFVGVAVWLIAMFFAFRRLQGA